jgi:hypothetical protein
LLLQQRNNRKRKKISTTSSRPRNFQSSSSTNLAVAMSIIMVVTIEAGVMEALEESVGATDAVPQLENSRGTLTPGLRNPSRTISISPNITSVNLSLLLK